MSVTYPDVDAQTSRHKIVTIVPSKKDFLVLSSMACSSWCLYCGNLPKIILVIEDDLNNFDLIDSLIVSFRRLFKKQLSVRYVFVYLLLL